MALQGRWKYVGTKNLKRDGSRARTGEKGAYDGERKFGNRHEENNIFVGGKAALNDVVHGGLEGLCYFRYLNQLCI